MTSTEPPLANRPDTLPAEDPNPFQAPRAALEWGEVSFVSRTDEKLNPWISIWTKPRATIRQIVDTNPKYWVLPLAMLSGFAQTLDNASSRNLGDHVPLAAVFAVASVLGPLSGLATLFLFGALVRWTGSWLGGVANSQQVRAALAWGRLPVACTLVLIIPLMLLFGRDIFASDIDDHPNAATMDILRAVLGLMVVVLAIWQVVLGVKCVAEVHQFSAWKGLGALFLAGLVLFVIVIPVLVLVVMAVDFA